MHINHNRNICLSLDATRVYEDDLDKYAFLIYFLCILVNFSNLRYFEQIETNN